MKTILASAATGIVGAVLAAVIVLAVDDGDTTIIQQPPTAVQMAGEAPAQDRQPIAAGADQAQEAIVEPEGAIPAVEAPAITSPFATFDPEQIFRQVSPSVVAIEVSSNGTTPDGGGSGFFIDTEGHIVTNYHVVQNARLIMVVAVDGTRVEAQVLGFDVANDLAVLLVDPAAIAALPVVLADSAAVLVGEPVAAIGNPFGLQGSLTTGIVSAVERTRAGLLQGGRPQRGLIQTDAAINPGNSGGVLVNALGEVIGITASVESPVRGNVGVGFAIASNTLTHFLPQLIAGEEVLHPWLGIQGGDSGDGPGLLVADVVPGGPSDFADLRGGDRLLSVDGMTLDDFEALVLHLDRLNVGDVVTFEVDRGGDTITIDVELAAWPG